MKISMEYELAAVVTLWLCISVTYCDFAFVGLKRSIFHRGRNHDLLVNRCEAF